MKLLLISVLSEKSHGGISVWTKHFLSGCQSEGIDVELVNTEVVGGRLVNATAKRSLTDEFVRTRRIFKSLKNSLKNNCFDAVHLNTSCGTFGLFRDLLIAKHIKRKKIRLITHYHCDIPFWIRKPSGKKALQKLALLSDENVVLCENSRKYLEENFGIYSVKMPNFIDDAVVASQKNTNTELKRAVFVGRISKAKGAAELFEIARRFPDITFELIGEMGADMAEQKIPANVVLSGAMPHDKLLEHLDCADIFVFPSHSEGFSLALTEAMARGIPAVATDVGANADMLCDGCGYIVDIGDINAMQNCISELTEASVREKISANAIKKVKENYLTDVIVKRFKQLYVR